MKNVKKQWQAGNNDGSGWAPSMEDLDYMGICAIEAEEGAAYRYTEDEILVFERANGGFFGVADANGAWAVELDGAA